MPNRLSRFCDGLMEPSWLLGLVITPLFFDIFSSRVFEPDKITLLRSLALAALAAWLIKLIAERGPRFEASRSNFASLKGILRAPLVVPVLFLMIVYIMSTIFSVSPHASLFGSYQRLEGTYTTFSYLILFAVIAANLRRRAQVERAITIAIIISGSRGPWLGLMAAFFFFFILLSLHWRARTLTLITVGLAGLLAVFLVLLNVPNGPLVSLADKPGIGRLADVFDTQGGTGKV